MVDTTLMGAGSSPDRRRRGRYAMDSPTAPKIPRPHRFLVHGESVIASTGLILAVILLTFMGSTAYWVLRVQRATVQETREAEIQSLGKLLSETTQLLIALDELSMLRRLVTETARTCELDRCRIVLGDGRILADADPSRITAASLPESWANTEGAAASAPSDPSVLSLAHPFSIPQRGHARLELAARLDHPFSRYWEAQAGVAAIGAVALVALLLLYRRMRSRIVALGVVREALLALAGGEREPAALAVRDDMGLEAQAWNRLIDDKQKLRKQITTARIEEVLASRSAADQRLHEMCNAMRQGIILLDRNLCATYANGAAAVYLATPVDEITGSAIAEFIPSQKVREAVETAVTGSSRSWTSIEVDQRGEESGSVLRFSVRPLRHDDASAAMIAIHDVTQQRVADEARNSFIAHVTHELRAPLTNILLYAETAIEEGADDATVRANCLNVINQEARRLEGIVSDMLSVSEIEAGTMQLRKDDVHLDVMLDDLRADYARQASEKDIELTFELPPKLPVVHADREKLGLALHNLVNNAIKYTSAGGRIVVKVDVSNDCLVVDVVDSGIGINEADVARIFEKFYRAQDPKVAEITGSGIGLALAREVVRLHGGDIQVESQIDQGSTFSLSLPLVAKAA
jgi:signal transduction histidine kinase